MRPLLLPLPGNETLARALADRTRWSSGRLETRHFPDGETYLRVDADCSGASVILLCTLARPDARLLPLLFAADTVRELGASRVGLVAPYLAYMRQDRRFHEGEALTSRSFADLLSSRLDWLVTVDPHLHRYHSLEELYRIPARVVHSAPALAAWISGNVERPLLVGPDEESAQWVEDVGRRAAAPVVVLEKTRRGDLDVEVSVPHVERYGDRTPVILDDIVASGRTMIRTAERLRTAGLRSPICVGVHAILGAEAGRALEQAGVARLVTTTSVPHETSAIDVTDLLVPAIAELVAPVRGATA